MTAPISETHPAAPAMSPARAAKLQTTAKQLEGVFVQQMLKAMRASIPKDASMPSNTGEETFTSMFDEKIAEKIPTQWQHGLTAALVQQLEARETK